MDKSDIVLTVSMIHEMVWGFRDRDDVHPYWKTPTPLDALKYAIEEASEAMKAEMREKLPDHPRNSPKSDAHSAPMEMATVAIMLASAVRHLFVDERLYDEPFIISDLVFTVAGIAAFTQMLALNALSDDDLNRSVAWELGFIVAWFAYNDENLVECIKKVLDGIFEKFCEPNLPF